MNWVDSTVDHSVRALSPLADPERADGSYSYMKQVAPFIGVTAPDRRRALRNAWAQQKLPTSAELGEAARELMALPEREFHYAAYDLIAAYNRQADEDFLRVFARSLITMTPWWDTVDGLVNAMVSPLMKRFHDDALIDEWSGSGDRWLIRAAIGHQRGWKQDTDVERVLSLSDAHWADPEFFVAKAIGWAMRDITRFDPDSVREFLTEHDPDNRVAIREARRGLDRTTT